MLNCHRHTPKIGRGWFSVCYPLPYPTAIGEKHESKTTIQGLIVVVAGVFGLFVGVFRFCSVVRWGRWCFARRFRVLMASAIVAAGWVGAVDDR